MPLSYRLWTGLLSVLLVALVFLWLAASLTISEGEWANLDQQLHYRQDASQPLQAVERLFTPEISLQADVDWLIDEPDLLDALPRSFLSLDQVGQLQQALQQNRLTVELASGEQLQLQARTRSLPELSVLFWLQWVCGLLALMICVVVMAIRPGDLVLRLFVLTGVGYAFSALAASVYSTRELFIATELWRSLSILNHTGALLFVAALSSLLWCYPLRLPGWRWLLPVFFTVAAGSLLANYFEWLDSFSLILHTWILAIFSLGIAGAIWQWRRTQGLPRDRATLRWLQLSVLAGTFFFTAFNLVPVALNEPPVASQAILLATFLLMYVGVALGVMRYRLFELERWSSRLWSWGLGGAAVVLVDLLLISLLSWSGRMSLAVSVALVGWMYFPVRQWFWRRLGSHGSILHRNWLQLALPRLIAARDQDSLPLAFAEASQSVFEPLEKSWQDTCPYGEKNAASGVSIQDQGESLCIPLQSRYLVLRFAADGKRLFDRDDVRAAEYLLLLYSLTEQSIAAHQQGSREERERIQQDVHDDLGAKLQTLLHQVPIPQQSLVRDSLRELRQLLRALDGRPESLQQLLERCAAEAQERCQEQAVQLEWQLPQGLPDIQLSARQCSELERIFREAVTNALKQEGVQHVDVDLSLQYQQLQLLISNDACVTDEIKPGRGLLIMQKRAARLGGSLDWLAAPPLWQLHGVILLNQPPQG